MANVSLTVPFERANTWDCPQDVSQPQRCFANRGEIAGDVAYYGVSYESQKDPTVPLQRPLGPAPVATGPCSGPVRIEINRDACVSNVVSRPVESCSNVSSKDSPSCANGLTPVLVGCSDGEGRRGGPRAQWQCIDRGTSPPAACEPADHYRHFNVMTLKLQDPFLSGGHGD